MSAQNQTVNTIQRELLLRGVHGNTLARAEYYTNFQRPPALTATIATELDWALVGTATVPPGTPNVNGGTAIQTQTTTPATTNTTKAINVFPGALNVEFAPRFEALVSLTPTIGSQKEEFWNFGFRTLLTLVDPTTETGQAAGFFAQGSSKVAVNDTEGIPVNATNWYVHEAHGGVSKFVNTKLPYVLNKNTKLAVRVGTDLKARYYLNDQLVFTGTVFTVGNAMTGFTGVELTATPGGTGKYSLRYVKLSREFAVSA